MLRSVNKFIHEKLFFSSRLTRLGELIPKNFDKKATILDVGCGTGEIAVQILSHRPDLSITGLEIKQREICKIPCEEFDGEHIPFEDNSFDYILFVDVLHHTDDPLPILKEAARVARKGIVIKDHYCNNKFVSLMLSCSDWFANNYHGVYLPFNFQSKKQFAGYREKLNMSEEDVQIDLQMYFPLAAWILKEIDFIAFWKKSN